MGDVLNLRMARKRAERRRDEAEAAANRVVHGRPKAERKLTAARSDKARRDLDQHRIGEGEINEIAGHQALHRDRRAQDERES
jgi:hypothetical protein